MGGLGVYFEEAGLATTQISLIRIHSERVRPPRALWVPFELGRPLGVPNDAAFQKRVLRAAFALLDAESGPILIDYPHDVPPVTQGSEEQAMNGMVCPIDLAPPPDATASATELGLTLAREVATLAPWYELAVTRRARTTVGPSGLSIADATRYLAAFVEDQNTPCPRTDMPSTRVLKLAYEDLKAYYGEAITMQPGYATSKRVEDWLFRETVLGAALWRLRTICQTSTDEQLRILGRNSIVPDRQINPATHGPAT